MFNSGVVSGCVTYPNAFSQLIVFLLSISKTALCFFLFSNRFFFLSCILWLPLSHLIEYFTSRLCLEHDFAIYDYQVCRRKILTVGREYQMTRGYSSVGQMAPFYVFPCGHAFHSQCLIAHVTRSTNEAQVSLSIIFCISIIILQFCFSSSMLYLSY